MCKYFPWSMSSVDQGMICYVDGVMTFHSYPQFSAKYFHLGNNAQPCNLNGKERKSPESTAAFLKIVL